MKPFKAYLKEAEANQITVDVPLFIRLLEYAKEDAKTDLDLHYVAERATKLMSSGRVLTMTEYNTLVGK